MNYTFNVDQTGHASISLFTNTGKLKISNGYNRIVVGGRGPYVELTDLQIIMDSFHIPKNQLYRLTDKRVYYVEFRSNDLNNIKLYYQLQTVAYADYKIGMFYISPFDLYLSTGECMSTIKNKFKITENEFFT